MDVLLFVLLAVGILLLVSGTYLFFAACLRHKELPWLVEEKIKNTSYAKYYDYIVQSDRWLKEHRAEDVYIESYDGLKLHGLWIPAENPRGTLLFAHGYRSTILLDFGQALEFYHRIGMNILLPDQRSHGKSQGRFITFGIKESKDMQSWISFHNREFGMQPILLDGLSMGASTMLYLADKELPNNVKGILGDCGFTSPKDIIRVVFKRVTHLPAGPSVWIAELWARFVAGFSLSAEDTRKTLARSRLPVLLVHGMADDFVPCQMTKEGYAVCTGPKRLLLVENAGHGVSFLVEQEKYTGLVVDFLNEYVFEKPMK